MSLRRRPLALPAGIARWLRRQGVRPTSASARGVIERLDTPRPARTRASNGSAAASPHTPTGLLLRAAADVTISIMRSSAGCHGSFSAARGAECRSAANTYWARSFVPMLTKSTSAKISSVCKAAAGVSIMTPMIGRPMPRAVSAKLRVSATVLIIGAITQISASSVAAASLIAIS